MRTVLFGDGVWATHSLLRLREQGHETAAVVLRVHPTETSLEHVARACGVPVLQPHNVNAAEFLARVRALEPDVNLSIAYNQIFGVAIRGTVAWFLNVHAGKLPRYRGRNVLNWALINGERDIGVTVHQVDEGIDTGPILLQRTLSVPWSATYGDVLERVQGIVPDLVVEAFALIARGEAVTRAQPPGEGTYCPGRREGDEWLDWTATSRTLHNVVRALAPPGPGARTCLDGRPVVIWRASYDPRWPRYLATPGCVVGRLADGAIVKTGDSTLLVQEVQVDGGPIHVPDWAIGTRLGLDVLPTLHALMQRIEALEHALAERVAP